MNNTTKELTGRIRYRVQKRFFKEPLVVLQVEVRIWGHYMAFGVVKGPSFDLCIWRDAEIGDVTVKNNQSC